MASAILESLNGFMGGRTGFSPETLFKFSNLDVRVQRHLSRVYLTLTCATALAALGCYAHIALGIHGIITQITAFACLLGLSFISNDPRNLNKRLACLGGFSFCQGAALGPLVGFAMHVNPAAILTAFLCTSAVFVSFSISALITQRRSYLYLGGYLASAAMAMMALRLGGWMFGAGAVTHSVELYGGLLMFSAYILYDTQLIVERAAAGEMDHVRHALDLLVDLIAIFVRVLIILIKRGEDEKRREAERKKRK